MVSLLLLKHDWVGHSGIKPPLKTSPLSHFEIFFSFFSNMCLVLSVAWNVCGRCHGDTRRIPPSKREQIQLMRGHTHTYTHTTWHNIHDPTANGGMVTPRWTPTEAPLLDSLHCPPPPKRNKPVEVYNTTAAHTADCFEMSLVTANLLSCLPVLPFLKKNS